MTEDEGTAMYYRHQGLVHKLSKKFSIVYFKQMEDMLEVSQEALSWAITHYDRYDPEKGKESTWIYQCIYWGLMTEVGKKKVPTISLGALVNEEEDTFDIEEKVHWTAALLKEVGEEAAFLIRTITDAPAEILAEMAPEICAKARNAVKNYLIDELDWDKKRLNKAWKEVESCLSTQG